MNAIKLLEKLSEKYHGDAYSEIIGAIAEVKAKDEEIEKIRTLLMKSNRESVLIGNKICESKARAIVAMLFWEAKKWDRSCGYGTEQANTYMNAFDRAYAMLKNNKCKN